MFPYGDNEGNDPRRVQPLPGEKGSAQPVPLLDPENLNLIELISAASISETTRYSWAGGSRADSAYNSNPVVGDFSQRRPSSPLPMRAAPGRDAGFCEESNGPCQTSICSVTSRRRRRCLPLRESLFQLSNLISLLLFVLLSCIFVTMAVLFWFSIRGSIHDSIDAQHEVNCLRLSAQINQMSVVAQRACESYAYLMESYRGAARVNRNTSARALCSVLKHADDDYVLRGIYMYSVTQREAAGCFHGNPTAASLSEMAAAVTVNAIHQNLCAVNSTTASLILPLQILATARPGWENITKSLIQRYGTPYRCSAIERFFRENLTEPDGSSLWDHQGPSYHLYPYYYPFRMYDSQERAAMGIQDGEAIIDVELDISRLVTGPEWCMSQPPSGGLATVAAGDAGFEVEDAPPKVSDDELRSTTHAVVLQAWDLADNEDPAVISNNWGQTSVVESDSWSPIFGQENPQYLHVSNISNRVMSAVLKHINFTKLQTERNAQQLALRYKGRRYRVEAKHHVTDNGMSVVYVLATGSIIPTYYYYIICYSCAALAVVLVTVAARVWVEICLAKPLRRIATELNRYPSGNVVETLKTLQTHRRIGLVELATLEEICVEAMTQIELIGTFIRNTGGSSVVRNDTARPSKPNPVRSRSGRGGRSGRWSTTGTSSHQYSPDTTISSVDCESDEGDTSSSPNVVFSSHEEQMRFSSSYVTPMSRLENAAPSRGLCSAMNSVAGWRTPPSQADGAKGNETSVLWSTTVSLRVMSATVPVGSWRAPRGDTTAWPRYACEATGTPFPTADLLQGYMNFVADGCDKYDVQVAITTPGFIQLVFNRHMRRLQARQQHYEERSRRKLSVTFCDQAAPTLSSTESEVGGSPWTGYQCPSLPSLRVTTITTEEFAETVANDALDAAAFTLSVYHGLTRQTREYMRRRARRQQASSASLGLSDPSVGESGPPMHFSATVRGDGGSFAATPTPGEARRKRSVKGGRKERTDSSATVTVPQLYALLHTEPTVIGWHTTPHANTRVRYFHGTSLLFDLPTVPVFIGAPMLITEQTYNLVHHAYRAIPLEAIEVPTPTSEVRGVVLYELLPGCATTPAWLLYHSTFCKAFASMLAGSYAEALAAFGDLRKVPGVEEALLPKARKREGGRRQDAGWVPEAPKEASTARTTQVDRLIAVCRERIASGDGSCYIRRPLSMEEAWWLQEQERQRSCRQSGTATTTFAGSSMATSTLNSMSTTLLLCHMRRRLLAREGRTATAAVPVSDGPLSDLFPADGAESTQQIRATTTTATRRTHGKANYKRSQGFSRSYIPCGLLSGMSRTLIRPRAVTAHAPLCTLTDEAGTPWSVPVDATFTNPASHVLENENRLHMIGESARRRDRPVALPVMAVTPSAPKHPRGALALECLLTSASPSPDPVALVQVSGRCAAAMDPQGRLAVVRVFALRPEHHTALQGAPASVMEELCERLFGGPLGSEHTVAVLGHHWHVDAQLGMVGCLAEYHAGGTLRETMQRYGRALPVAAVRRYARCVFAGLASLHAQGVAHGDVRPENVLVGCCGSDAKLTGFFGSRETAERVLVLRGSAYVSPETARGQVADAHSDVFCAALVVLEAVTGQLPWRWTCGSVGCDDGDELGETTSPALLAGAAAAADMTANPFADAVRSGRLTVALPPAVAVDDAVLLRVLEACLCDDPSQRPSATVAHAMLCTSPAVMTL